MPDSKLSSALAQAIVPPHPVAEAVQDVKHEENVITVADLTVSAEVPAEPEKAVAEMFREAELSTWPEKPRLKASPLDAELVARVLGHFGIKPGATDCESIEKVAANMGVVMEDHATTLQKIGVRLGMASRGAIVKELLS